MKWDSQEGRAIGFRLFVAGLPFLLLVSIFVYPALTGRYLWLTSRELLGVIVQIEWLVLASGLFLLFALLVPAATNIGKSIATVYVMIVSLGFALTGAVEIDGARGFVLYLVLLFTNYGLTVILPGDHSRYTDALVYGARWVFLMFVFFTLVGAIGFPTNVESWHGANAELLGVIFFSVMAVLDLGVMPYALRAIDGAFHRGVGVNLERKSESERAQSRRRMFGIKNDRR